MEIKHVMSIFSKTFEKQFQSPTCSWFTLVVSTPEYLNRFQTDPDYYNSDDFLQYIKLF